MKGAAIFMTAVTCAVIAMWPTAKSEKSSPEVETTVIANAMPTRGSASVPQATLTPVQELEHRVLESQLTLRESSILHSKSVNDWEKRLKVGIIARLHADRIHGGENLGGLYVIEMKKDPRGAFEAITSLLAKLPAREFPIDRASLIDVAADLPGLREEAKQLARNELRLSIVEPKRMPSGSDVTEEELDRALTSDDFELLPMVAHSALMRVTESREEALRLTIEALQEQRDFGIRETLANQFLGKFPDAKEDLYREIALARIEMPIQGEN